MKNVIIFLALSVSMNQSYGMQDTTLMKSLIRNVFDAKKKLEGGEFLSKQNWTKGSITSSTIETFFTNRGITTNVDSLSKQYDFHVQQIKDKKTEFLSYYNKLSNLGDVQNYVLYDFKDPYSSIINTKALMSYHDCVEIVKHFIIDLDRDRLPSLEEAVRYLEEGK